MKRTAPLLLPILLAACGTDVSGPSATVLSCVFGEPTHLGVGEVLQVRGEGNRSVCLSPDAQSDYVYIPFFATTAPGSGDPAVSLDVEIMGAGLYTPPPSAAAVAGDPAADPAGELALRGAPGGRRLDEAFHRRLRQRELDELEPRLHPVAPPAGRVESPGALKALAVPSVGQLMTFNVAISCTEEDLRTGRIEYVSEHAVVVADTANPVDLAPSDYAFFGVTFDTLVYPVGTEHFGVPSDIDENGRTIMFLTRAVNELTPRSSATITAGFFWSGDVFPATSTPRADACPAANQAEMFYVLAPDPSGQYGPAISLEALEDLSVDVIGHEYQHLVNASRRIWVNDATVFERPWLNEGLSHIAEELLFYAVSGLQPRQNLTIADVRAVPNGVWSFNRYVAPDFTDLSRYLTRPDTSSLMGIDNLATRGATWSFLRYAADRSGRGDAAFFFDVVNSTTAGLDNLDAVLGASALAWMQDWTVSVFADDVVPGLAPRYSQASWDIHDVFQETLGEFPLVVTPLVAGTPLSLDLLPGGAAFPAFSVEAGGRAAVHVEADGGTPPATLRGSFIRIR